MTQYKKSRYNLIVNYASDSIVYNTRTRQIVAKGSDAYKALNSEEPYKDNNSAMTLDLLNRGFLIEENIDEIELVKEKRLEVLKNKDKYIVLLFMTRSCNLACWYCYQGKKEKRQHMSHETAAMIVRHIAWKHNTQRFKELVVRLYGGEPTCNMAECIYIIESCKRLSKQLGFSLVFHITTNCTNITDELIDALRGCRVQFQITIDGNKERHDKVRKYHSGKGTYDLIMDNLHRLYEELPNTLFGIRINYDNDILSDDMVPLMTDLMFLKGKLFISLNRIFQLKGADINSKLLDRNIALINRLGIPLSCGTYQVGISCSSAFENFLMVDWDGSIKQRCPGNYNKECNITLNADGSITGKESLEYINYLSRQCTDCILLPMCSGYCYRNSDRKSELECQKDPQQIIKFTLKQKQISINGNLHR